MQNTVANAASPMIVICDHRLENHDLMVSDFELTPSTWRLFHTIWHHAQHVNLGKEEGMGGGKFPSNIWESGDRQLFMFWSDH